MKAGDPPGTGPETLGGVQMCIRDSSMGSFIARMYLTQYGQELTGAVLCGTTGGNPMAGMGAFLAGRTASAKGPRHRSAALTKICLLYTSRCV